MKLIQLKFLFLTVAVLSVGAQKMLAQSNDLTKGYFQAELGVSNFYLQVADRPSVSEDIKDRITSFTGGHVGLSRVHSLTTSTNLLIGIRYQLSGVATSKFLVRPGSSNTPEASIAKDHYYFHSAGVSALLRKQVTINGKNIVSVAGGIVLSYDIPENFRRKTYADFNAKAGITIRSGNTVRPRVISIFGANILGEIQLDFLEFLNNKMIPILNFGYSAFPVKTEDTIVINFADAGGTVRGRLTHLGLKVIYLL
ncbi:hypothetical protein [Neolewinella antarctica]|uniref:PorT family protein n=1 Tax=Neolewinella antarctica TaxID=442734 RepID=A0ABX0X7Q3_9BACT|nr:hypothetical protein [Neolewinella antarctica]NJC24857.1 hypothetical protein [Neolewinella antarctica]